MTVRNRPVRDPHAGVVWEGRSREAPPYPDGILYGTRNKTLFVMPTRTG